MLDRIKDYLSFLTAATNNGSIVWNRDEDFLIFKDPDDKDAVKITKESSDIIAVSLIGFSYTFIIDKSLFPSLEYKVQELYDAARLNNALRDEKVKKKVENVLKRADLLISQIDV